MKPLPSKQEVKNKNPHIFSNKLTQRRPIVFCARWLPSVIWGAAMACLLFGCEIKDSRTFKEYKGPMREAIGSVTYYTEAHRLKVLLKAAKILEYANGDKEFPQGIDIEFYDDTGNKSAELKANYARYSQTENRWLGRGNVIVRNLEKNEKLTTEELFWEPATKRILTEKFVTISLKTEVLYGTGLIAKQDMSEYQITNPGGEFEANEE